MGIFAVNGTLRDECLNFFNGCGVWGFWHTKKNLLEDGIYGLKSSEFICTG